jgi:hypothetical protein
VTFNREETNLYIVPSSGKFQRRTKEKMRPDDEGKYAFINSTPSFSAKEQKETRTLVRKHVMRPYMKQKQNHTRPKRVNGLKVIAPRIPASEVQPNPSTEAELLDEENGAPLGPQIGSTLMLGGGRTNPFQAYPIAMGVKQHELVHFSMSYHMSLFSYSLRKSS